MDDPLRNDKEILKIKENLGLLGKGKKIMKKLSREKKIRKKQRRKIKEG